MSTKPKPAGAADLLAYLDALGVDGPPTADGWHVVLVDGAACVAKATDMFGTIWATVPGNPSDVLPFITRHAPLRLAARVRSVSGPGT